MYIDLPSEEMNYFIFTPTQSGLYRFSLSNTNAELSYWGGNEFFITDQTVSTDMMNNSFTLNVKEGNLGICCILGAAGDNGGIITIERIGDATLDITDIPYDIYEPEKEPTKFVSNETGKLTYVNIEGLSSDYKLFYNSNDGYYHLESENGPIAYVSLGEMTPYISYKVLIDTTGVKTILYNENGEFVAKEDYTSCMYNYINCIDDTTGIIPLDKDLIYILSNHIDYMGWCDPSNSVYLFTDLSNVNNEIAWMFLICYFK